MCGLHEWSNLLSCEPLSPGSPSPEADLCGEPSRHHKLVWEFAWTLLFLWAVGPVAPNLKDAAKQGFNDNQMQHCPPGSSDIICVRSPSDSRAVRGKGKGCLIARDKQSSAVCSKNKQTPRQTLNTYLYFKFFFASLISRFPFVNYSLDDPFVAKSR